MAMDLRFRSVLQLLEYFSCNPVCIRYLEAHRWQGNPICPHCASAKKPYVVDKGISYKCADKDCAKRFNVLTGTIFENTKLELRYWFAAIYLVANHKKGISSHQLARDLGITQKTAWFMLQRIREMLREQGQLILDGTVEADETFIGGEAKNRHGYHGHKDDNGKPSKIYAGKQGKPKQPVAGVVERGGKVILKPVPNVGKKQLTGFIKDHVSTKALLYTDEHTGYASLPTEGYAHQTVNHSKGKYVIGDIHTQTIEGFWSQMKRGIYGVYHQVSVKHLGSYCNEFSYKWNTRKMEDQERFNQILTHTNYRIRWKDLVGRA